ncbi:MAG TPA: SGNH/GDSL hydrolase family protein [Planctomycetota bacterium]|nr:SGNH/GDSL hydrolase family protein [Planctomycetota bacterium]
MELRKGQLIVCDGDSLTNRRSTACQDTWPFLRLMNWDKPWPDVMAEMLFCWRPELKLSFFNAASGGSTCRGLAERFEASVLARKPGWVIASLGGNDARVGVPHEEFRETMSTYARRLVEEAGAKVLFFGLSEHGPDYPKADTQDARRAFYDILSDIAEHVAGVHYADIGPSLAAKAAALREQSEYHTLYADGGHFNAVGNLVVAGEILHLFGVVSGSGSRIA